MIQTQIWDFIRITKIKAETFCCCCKNKMGLSLSSISLARPPGIAMKGKLDGRDASITLLEKDLSLKFNL